MPLLAEDSDVEEDEEMFCRRIKLFVLNSLTKKWKERGVGEITLLKHHDKGMVQILVRNEVAKQLVCNNSVLANMELKSMAGSDLSCCWSAVDQSGCSEQDRVELFAARFEDIKFAREFKEKFEEAKRFVQSSQQKSRTLTAPSSEKRNVTT